jgi:hypothetical protein
VYATYAPTQTRAMSTRSLSPVSLGISAGFPPHGWKKNPRLEHAHVAPKK